MGINRYGGGVKKEDLSEDALDGGIKRNASGTIQFTSTGTATSTGTTGTNTLNISGTGRHVADKNKVVINEGGAGTLTWTLKRNGAQVTQKTGVTANTSTTITKTFSAVENPTWSLVVSPTAGTWTASTWTASVEDVRS